MRWKAAATTPPSGAPWLLDGIASPLATWNGVISGAILIVLAIPRGRIKDSYAGWDRYVV
jgi:hypothetical protein